MSKDRLPPDGGSGPRRRRTGDGGFHSRSRTTERRGTDSGNSRTKKRKRGDRDSLWNLRATQVEDLEGWAGMSRPGTGTSGMMKRLDSSTMERLKQLRNRLAECIDRYAIPVWQRMVSESEGAEAYDIRSWKRELVERFYDMLHDHEVRWSYYWKQDDLDKLRKLLLYAACYAVKMHAAQKPRKTGEPYVMHPFRVAGMAAEKGLDSKGIAAAYLHDVVEDTDTTVEEIRQRFGSTIATVVEAVSKVKYRPSDDASDEDVKVLKDKSKVHTYLKILGTASGVNLLRAVILKVFDRLDNMRTVGVFRDKKRQRYAWETLTIYCSLAMELGMNQVAQELTELSLKAIYGEAEILSHQTRVQIQISSQRSVLRQARQVLWEILDKEGIEAQVRTIQKPPLWSYYDFVRREFRKRAAFLRIKVVLESVDDLYKAIGVIHVSGDLPVHFKAIDEIKYLSRTSLYKVHAHMMRDHVTSPLPNGYTALLTAIEMNNTTLRVELVTPAMEEKNDKGVLANFTDPDILEAYGRHLDTMYRLIQSRPGLSYEQLQELMMQSSQGLVVVYDEEGRSQELPYGATVMDYAYMVARDVAMSCRGAYVNKVFQPPEYVLSVGDTVHLEFSDEPVVRPSLLCRMRSPTAMQTYLSDMMDYLSSIALEEGRDVITRLALANGAEPSVLLSELSEADLMEVGFGRRSAHDLLQERKPDLFSSGGVMSRARVTMVDRQVRPFRHPFYRMCPDCNVLPWMEDAVAQYAFDDKLDECASRHGVPMVYLHTEGCSRIDYSKPRFKVQWHMEPPEMIGISMKVMDEVGMAARITERISAQGFNIISMNVQDKRDDDLASMCIRIDTSTISQDNPRARKLAKLFRHLRTIRGITRIRVHVQEDPEVPES